MLDLIFAAIAGIFVGGLVNALADELPYRTFFRGEIEPPEDATDEERAEYATFNVILAKRNKRGYVPAYPDGTLRPVTAWLGLSAFALGLREPAKPQPDEIRERPHRESKLLEWRHPLTEIMTAIFFMLAVDGAGSIGSMTTAQYLLNFVYMAIFALIIVIDVEHKLILFVVMIPSIALGFLDAIFVSPPPPDLTGALTGAGIGFGAFFSIYLLGFVFRWYMNTFRGRNINTTVFGYGDVMMLTFTGTLVGDLYTWVAIIITILLGAAGAIIFLLAQRVTGGKGGMTSAIPYGPYIVLATIIMHLYGAEAYILLFR